MNSTVAQKAQENERFAENAKEKPQYVTTKELHYPVSNFQKTMNRVKQEWSGEKEIHDTLKKQNFHVLAQGHKHPVQASVKQQDFVADKLDKTQPPPERYNQEVTTGNQNQNLKQNYEIGPAVVSTQG